MTHHDVLVQQQGAMDMTTAPLQRGREEEPCGLGSPLKKSRLEPCTPPPHQEHQQADKASEEETEADDMSTDAAPAPVLPEITLGQLTLTKNFAKDALTNTKWTDEDKHPVLQVYAFKVSEKTGGRYRVAFSDGEGIVQSVLNISLSALFEKEEIVRYSIVEVTKYMINMINGINVLLVQDLVVIKKDAQKIGNPIADPSKGAGATNNKEPEKENHDQTHPEHGVPLGYPTPDKTPNRPASMQMAVATTPKTPSSSDVVPIQSINPYHKGWCIKARVTQKSDIRTFTSARGEGRLFNIDLADESGEIRATAFGDQVAKFYDMFEKNKVYIISRMTVKTAKRQFNTLRNEYQISLEADTIVTRCDEDATLSVPKTFYNFTSIGQIESVPKDAHVDLLGIVKEVSELQTITPKADPQKKMTKREVKLMDRSLKEVTVTLWGATAESFVTSTVGDVIAFKALRVSDFNGRTLSSGFSTVISVNPQDIPETNELLKWYENNGSRIQTTSISVRSSPNGKPDGQPGSDIFTFKRVDVDKLGMGEKPDFFSVRGTVLQIPHEKDIWYSAEPETNHKMIQQSDGTWLSERSQKTYPKCVYRYILRCSIADCTGTRYANAFGDEAALIVGMTANNLEPIKESNPKEFESVFTKAIFRSYMLRMRAKTETYQNESRVKLVVVGVQPIDFVKDSKTLIQQIRLYL